MKLAKRAHFALCTVLLFVFGFGALASCTAILGIDTDYADNLCNSDKAQAPIVCGKGGCLQIVDFCGENGLPQSCPEGNPFDEKCNGIDDNCDGVVDEGCPCTENAKQDCYRGSTSTRKNGLCHDGTQVCKNGVWSDCGGDVLPVAELCDQRDNDCNGMVDDTAACTCSAGQTQTCYIGPDGTLSHPSSPCKEGKQTCTSDGKWGDCTGSIKPGPTELCDGDIDDNCDGHINEGCICQPGDTGSCYSGPVMPLDTNGVGVCHSGTWICINGMKGPCMNEVTPSPEQCNAQDDDCNGKEDDGDFGVGMPCTVSNQFGPCQVGVRACDQMNGAYCNQTTLPSPEGCDGIDNDCNGKIDDGNPGGGATCTIMDASVKGICTSGTFKCEGSHVICAQTTVATIEACNGKDDDCNGKVDDGAFCCAFGTKDGNETDIDCGGSCPPCAAGLICLQDKDCESLICKNALCQTAACNDFVSNGKETDVDCGGPLCPSKCLVGQTCAFASDCVTGVCSSKVCIGPKCSDGVQNSSETDVDCGGPLCNDCLAGQKCLITTDCQSAICNGNFCTVATCGDAVLNGTETDTDCGGAGCNACDNGKKCAVGPDCKSKVCAGGTCQAASCADGQLNGNEADVDCGGPCPLKCAIGKKCGIGGDCASAVCNNNFCAQKPNGAACGSTNECQSGNCIDTVCCDTPCGGVCQACTNAKKGGGIDGACGSIGAGADPDAECNDQGTAACATNGFCNGAGACQLYPFGTTCNTASCGGDGVTLNKADTCNGLGQCVDNGMLSCVPSTCAQNACSTICLTDSQCASSAYCNGSTCVGKKTDGLACGGGVQCLSGSCIDGICCNLPCNGPCEACTAVKKGTGVDGVCGNISPNSDPDNECMSQTSSTCGTTGVCDGFGKCQLHPSATVCTPSSCAANGFTLHKTDQCNGNGNCIDAGDQDCSPFACNGGACLFTCTVDSQCATGAYCAAPNCLTKQADGTSCMADKQCSNGHCADGVCCNSACGGTCQACTAALKGFGQNGTCANILVGNDPDSECPDQGALTCGANGSCDGNGACGKYGSGTPCVAAVCAGDGITLVNASTCNGSGTCQPNGTMSCNGYACSGGACLTICAADAQCAPTYFCNGVVCSVKKPNGNVCSNPNECASGSCADGYCCNTSCTTGCRACDLPGKLGTCSTVPAGTTDPPLCSGTNTCDAIGNCSKANGQTCAQASECGSGFCVDNVCCGSACNGACQACSAATKGAGADGVCGSAQIGTDPHNDCAPQPASSCGTTGLCDGSGACSKYPSATICAAASCNGTILNKDDFCNGSGVCVDSGPMSCGNYLCTGSACLTSCSSDAQCGSSAYCMMSNCVPKIVNGTACASGAVCGSGNCIDNFCCDTACGGTCKACSAALSVGANGTCSNVKTNTDPDGNCTAAVCADATTLTKAQVCNASAVCASPSPATTACSPFLCSGAACTATCAVDSDCASTAYCVGTTCTAKKAQGLACTASNQCGTGNCIDNFCCDTACGGTCKACSAALSVGVNGTCADITNLGTDTNPVCSGNNACRAGACLLAPGQACSNPIQCASNNCPGTNVCQ